MTVFLNPGDKIVLCAPASFSGRPTDQEITDALTKIYAELGVKVMFVALGNPQIPLTVVSVIREPKLMWESARQRKIPWQDPDPGATEPLRAHPGYQDHPRVP